MSGIVLLLFITAYIQASISSPSSQHLLYWKHLESHEVYYIHSSFYTCLVTWLERHCTLSTYILFASIIRGKTTQTSWHILQSSVHFTIQKILAGRQCTVTISISSGQFTTEWKREQQRWRSDSNKWKSKRGRKEGKTMQECTCSDCKLILTMRFWLLMQLQRITVNVKLR